MLGCGFSYCGFETCLTINQLEYNLYRAEGDMNGAYLTETKKLNVNKCADRAYYVPFDCFDGALTGRLQSSPAITLLNGEWQFATVEDVALLYDDAFLSKPYQNVVKVPSNPQMSGFDTPQYTNIRYPFPFDPPFIRKSNPAFLYRKTINIDKADRAYYIDFEGVDSCLYLYVNKRFVGFSGCSHATLEFEVGKFLTDGENTIDVVVPKWYVGSYFEDQDKWRFSGIFRNVYLLSRPKKHLRDYKVNTAVLGDVGRIEFVTDKKYDIKIHLMTESGIVTRGGKAQKSVVFEIENAVFWNAEQPHLYPFVIECGGEFIAEEVGIREITIEDGRVLLNGCSIRLRGVNRHEFYPTMGSAVDEAVMLHDLELLKKFNVNAIRTSHYPSAPYFYQLCDRMGFYVLCEADIECHGVVAREGDSDDSKFHYFADDKKWLAFFLDRASKLVERDKNRPSVIIWSLGNESGYGVNFEQMADIVRSLDGTRLIHYEGVWHRRREDIYYTDKLDLISRMYPEISWIESEYLQDEREWRPLVLCEYSHAMGNGPGDLADYKRAMDASERIVGGFIWEMFDHAILCADGKLRYGGDFNERIHDGNFCVDGIFSADRGEKPSSYEMAAVYCPVEVERCGDAPKRFRIKNAFDFIDIGGLPLDYTVRENGVVVNRATVILPPLAPQKSCEIEIDFSIQPTVFTSVVFECQQEAVRLKRGFVLNDFTPVSKGSLVAVCLTECMDKVAAETKNGQFTFNKSSGMLESVLISGQEQLLAATELNVFRAPTDNDIHIRQEWQRRGLDRARTVSGGMCILKDGEDAEISFDVAVVADAVLPIVRGKLIYRFYEDGLGIRFSGRVASDIEWLPRFGIQLCLKDDFSDVTYLGMGAHESYIGKNHATYRDVFTARADEPCPYLKPQEYGSHYFSQYVTVNSSQVAVKVTAERPFSFSVRKYSDLQLANAAHVYDLPQGTATYLNVDDRMSGVGSNSCGPQLDRKYTLCEKEMDFQFYVCFQKLQ